MTPEEAEEIMNPFYPHDPNLAIKTLSREISEEATVPDWILESIVSQYFQYLGMQKMLQKQAEMRKTQKDPFGLDTIPYTLNIDLPWMN
tara:strand:+ start:1487 stop:1753 length:267 start_codon:yes stop_codon:yes gene_type:complete